MSPFLRWQSKILLAVFILNGIFLLALEPQEAQAVHDPLIYQKPYDGTLSYTEWNGLFSDFVNNWLPVSLNGPVGIATSAPASGLTVNGPINTTNLFSTGNVGIVTAAPDKQLHVAGQAKFDNFAYGVTPVLTDTAALATVEYVNSKAGGSGGVGTGTSGQTLRHNGAGWIADSNLFNTGTNIGVGTTNPEAKIHIAANDFTTSLMDSTGNTWWYGNYDYFRRSRGTLASRTAVQDGDLIVNHNYQGYDGSTWQTGAGFQVKVDGAVTSGIVPMQYYLENRGADGTWRQNLVIRSTGNVGIGLTNPTQRLSLSGSMEAIASFSSELVTNGTFDANVNSWTNGGFTTIAWQTGTMHIVQAATGWNSVYQTITLTPGEVYSYSIGATLNSGTSLLFQQGPNNTIRVISASGTITGTFIASSDSANTIRFKANNAPLDWNFDNITIKKYNSGGQVIAGSGNQVFPSLTFTGDLNTGLFSPEADAVSIATGGTEKMRVFSNGNLAFDDFTNMPGAASNPTYKVFHFASPTSSGSTILSMASRNLHTVFFGDRMGTFVIGTEGTSNPIDFKTGLVYTDSDTLGSGNTVMRITGTGNVGIGTTTPTKLLQVAGGAKFDNYAYGLTPISSDTLALATVEYVNAKSGGAGGVGSGTSGQTLRHDGTGWVASPLLYNNGTNIGIGTTTPETKLVVAADATGNWNYSQLRIMGVTNPKQWLTLGYNTDGNFGRIQAGIAGAQYTPLALNPDGGNVGIGTTNPGAKLEVANAGDVAFTLNNTAARTWKFWSLNGGNFGIYDATSGAGYRMMINTAGNVGIGEVAPGSKLSVLGGISIGDATYSTVASPTGGAIIQGNVGIGTTAPVSRLQIDKPAQTIGATTPSGALVVSSLAQGNGGLEIGLNTSAVAWLQSRNITSNTNYILALQPNGGNLGIGTTTPTKLLQVAGGAKFDNYAYGLTPVQTDTLALATVEYVNLKSGGAGGVGSGTSGQTLRHDGTGWVGSSVIFNNGTNVGIGTTGPVGKLDIMGSSAGYDTYFGSVYGNTINFMSASDTDNAYGVINYAGYNNGATRYRNLYIDNGKTGVIASFIGSTGNVGIGTSTPGTLLDLFGANAIGRFNSSGWSSLQLGSQANIAGTKNYQITSRNDSFYIARSTDDWLSTSSYLIHINSNGNVGLGGMTNATDKLEVAGGNIKIANNQAYSFKGSDGFDIQMPLLNTSNNVYFGRRPNSNGTGVNDYYFRTDADIDRLTIKGSSGNVGIGTTTPGKLLQVAGGAKFDSYAYGLTPVQTDTLALATVEYVNAKSGGAGGVGAGTSGQTLRHDGTGWVGSSVLFNNGTNVGIGTSNPLQKLHLSSTNDLWLLMLGGTATSTSMVSFGAVGDDDWAIGRDTNNNFTISDLDGAGSRFLINKTSGNVGIGTTAPGSYKLNVQGGDVNFGSAVLIAGGYAYFGNPASGAYSNFVGNNAPGKNSFAVRGAAGQTANIFKVTDATGTVAYLDVNASGNVGIGTATPNRNLEISATQPIFRLTSTSGPLFESSVTTTYGRVGTVSNHPLYIQTNATNQMTIDISGNVGVGTTTPTQKFAVGGVAKFDGFAYGLTPIITQTDALATVEYVNASLVNGTGPWQRTAPYIYPSTITDNVGIGVTNPRQKLDVLAQSILIGADFSGGTARTDAAIKVSRLTAPHYTNSEEPTLVYEYSNQQTSNTLGIGGGTSAANAATAITFYTGANNTTLTGTQQMIINSGGNVGVGTTTPAAKLHVVSSTAGAQFQTVQFENNRGDYQGFKYKAANGTGDYLANNVLFEDARPDTAGNVLGSFFTIYRSGALTKGNIFQVGNTTAANSLVVSNGGNVGIGTTNPLTKLQINSGVYANGMTLGSTAGISQSITYDGTGWGMYFGMMSNGTGWIQQGRTNVATAYNLVLQAAGGNVGIGTTTPGKLLQVAGQAKFDSYAYGLTPVSTDTLALATVEYVNAKSGGAGGVGAGTSGQTLRHDGTGWVSNSTLYNNGTNVGIGTTNPGAKFELLSTSEQLRLDYNASTYVSFATDSSGNIRITPTGSAIKSGAAGTPKRIELNDHFKIYQTGADSSVENVINQDAHFIGSTASTNSPHYTLNLGQKPGTGHIQTGGEAGNVRIVGDFLAPAASSGSFSSLFVGGTINPDATATGVARGLYISQTLTQLPTGGYRAIDIPANNASAYGIYQSGANTKNYFAGNVGIGTTAPAAKLHVEGNLLVDAYNVIGEGGGLLLREGGSMYNTGISIRGHNSTSSPDGLVLGGYDGVSFSTGSNAYNPRMIVDTFGNVGIGTTTPGKLLQVAGQAKFDSYAYGLTPVSTDTLALTTVEYVNASLVNGTGPWKKTTTNIYPTTLTDNVGIGTTAPGAKLEVNGAAYLPKLGSPTLGTGSANVQLGSYSIIDKQKRELRIAAGGSAADSFNGVFKIKVVGNTNSVGTRSYIEKTIYIATYYSPGYIYSQKSYISEAMQSDDVRLSDFVYDSATDELVLTIWWVNVSSRSYDVAIEYFGKNASRFLTATVGAPITYTAGQEPAREIVSIAPDTNFFIPNSVGIGVASPSYKLDIDGAVQIRNGNPIRMGSGALYSSAWNSGGATYGTYTFGNASDSDTAIYGGNATVYLEGTAGNVGISSTTPTKKFAVAGQAKFDSYAYGLTPVSTDTLALATVEYVNAKSGGAGGVGAGTSGQTLRHNGTGWVADSNLFNNGTNVGIGTTAPGKKLDVLGDIKLGNGQSDGYGRLFLTQKTARTYPTVMMVGADDGTANELNVGGGTSIGYIPKLIKFHTAANDTTTGNNIQMSISSTGLVTMTQNLVVSGTGNTTIAGNVGIGTTNPSRLLSVQGVIAANDSGGVERFAVSPTSGGVDFHIKDSAAASTVRFDTRAGGISYINTGNVGIGSTTPAAKLGVAGGAIFDSFAYGVTPPSIATTALATVEYVNSQISGSSWTKGGDTLASIQNLGTLNSYPLPFITNNIERMRITDTGNLVIGATSTSVRLHVESPQGPVALFSSRLNGGTYSGYIGNGQTVSAEEFGLYYALNDAKLAVYDVASASLMYGNGITINNNTNNVGIGTTNPGAKLDVSGNVNVTGTMNVTGNFLSDINLTAGRNISFGNAGPGGTMGSFIWNLTNDTASMYAKEVSADQTDYVFKMGDNAVSDRYVWWIDEWQGPSFDVYPMILAGNYGNFYSGRLYIDNSTGNVGVGTTTPTKKFAVGGQAKFDGFAYALTPVQTDTAALATVEYVNAKSGGSGGVGAGTIGQTLRHDGTGWVANSTLYNNGTNVGVGITNPSTQFEVLASSTTLTISDNGNNYNQGSIQSTLYFNNRWWSGQTNPSVDAYGDAAIKSFKDSGDGTGGSGLSFWSSGNGGAGMSEWMRINKYGHVGIGTTNPGQKLDIQVPNSVASNVNYAINASIAGAATWQTAAGNFVNTDSGTGTGYGIFTSGPDFGVYSNGGTNYFNGNVGIGTTNPGAKLHVNGAIWMASTNVIGAGHDYGTLGNSASGYLELYSGNNGNTTLMNTGSYNLNLGVNNSIDFTIMSGGNVGIGTTTPGKLLHVAGQAKFDSYAYGLTPVSTDTLALTTVEYVNASLVNGTGPWKRTAPYIYPSTITDNVGIGTTAPAQKLHIETNGGIALPALDGSIRAIIEDATQASLLVAAASNSNILFGDASSSVVGRITYDHTNDSIQLWNASAEHLRITSAGNVGIGTTSPQALLNTYKTPTSGFVEQIRVGGTDNYPSLTFGTYGSYGGYMATYGNDMHLYAGNWRTIGTAATENHSMNFYTSKSGSTDWSTAKMVLNQDGNLGIGVAAPASRLQINNSFISSQKSLIINNANTALPAHTTYDTALISQEDVPAIRIREAQTAQELTFSVGNEYTNRATIGATGYLAFSTGRAAGTQAYLDSNTRMVIASDGSVGIGTTTPSQKLQVEVAGQGTLLVGNGSVGTFTTGQYGLTRTRANTVIGSYWGDTTGNALNVFTYTKDAALLVRGDGYVGISSTTPSKLLSVAGQAKFSDFAYGVTPISTQTDALATVEYVNASLVNGTGAWARTAPYVYPSTITDNVGIGITNPQAALQVNGGMIMKRTTVADANYTALVTDYIIGYTSISANRTVTLPSALCTPGRFFVILDESGSASGSAKIIIDPEGATPIVGQATFSLAGPYNSVYVFCGSSAWYVL